MQEGYPYYLGPESGAEIDGSSSEALIVRLVGEFDSCSERMFLSCIRELLCDGYADVQFDFSEVRFVDMCGLRCLFQAQRQFRRAGRQMTMTGLPEGLERILLMVSAQSLARAVEERDVSFPGPSHSVSA